MKEDRSQLVRTYIDRLKKAYNIRTDTELAKKLSLTQGAIGNWKKRGSFDFDFVSRKCPEISLDFLRLGTKPVFWEEREDILRKGRDKENEVDFQVILKENQDLKSVIKSYKEKENELVGNINGLKWVVKQVTKGLIDDDKNGGRVANPFLSDL